MGIKLSGFVKSSNWLNGETLKAILDDLEDDSVIGKITAIEEIEGESFDKKKKEQKIKLSLDINGDSKDMTLNNTQLKVLVQWLDSKGYEDDSDKLIGVNLNLSLTQAQNGKPSIVIAVSRKQSTTRHNSPNLSENSQQATFIPNSQNKADNGDYEALLLEVGRLIAVISEHSYATINNGQVTFATDSNGSEKTVKLLPYDTYSKATGVKLGQYKRDLEFCLDCLNSGFVSW